MQDTYNRIAILNIEACILLILHEQPLVINGHKVKVGGPRIRTYLKGTQCVRCGLKGSYFAVEACKPEFKNYHFNLYACVDGKETLMTSDHIKPKSKGGVGALRNRQPMCTNCNQAKGDRMEETTV